MKEMKETKEMKEMKETKEMKEMKEKSYHCERSDILWRFACGDVYLLIWFEIEKMCKTLQKLQILYLIDVQ